MGDSLLILIEHGPLIDSGTVSLPTNILPHLEGLSLESLLLHLEAHVIIRIERRRRGNLMTRFASGSAGGGPKWLRTKKREFGVR